MDTFDPSQGPWVCVWGSGLGAEITNVPSIVHNLVNPNWQVAG